MIICSSENSQRELRNVEDLEIIIREEIDYSKVNSKIDRERERTRKYLEENIEKAGMR